MSIQRMQAELEHHRAEVRRLVPLIAAARRNRELAHPTSYISIDGAKTVLRLVEEKTVDTGKVMIFRPLGVNEARYRFERPEPRLCIHADEFGLSELNYNYDWRRTQDYAKHWTWTDGSLEGWKIDFEIDGVDADGRVTSFVREVRYQRRHRDSDEDQSDDE